MPGSTKKQFIRRNTLPSVAAAQEFEERFSRTAEARRHYPNDIPIDLIDPSPFQIRQQFDNINELAAAIRVHGFTSRLWVREHPSVPGRYQLVFGERRLRAARVAGIEVIPCEVTQFDDRELLEIGLTENLQRQDLDPLEEAHGFQRFIDEFSYSYRELAERIGKDKGYIENRMRLLRLDADVQQMVKDRPDTVSAAREVARLPKREARAPLIDSLVEDGLSLKTTRTIVDAALREPERMSAIVTERVAAERNGRQQQLTDQENVVRRTGRELEHDWSLMIKMVDKWQGRMPELLTTERSKLQEHIDHLLTALEILTNKMR